MVERILRESGHERFFSGGVTAPSERRPGGVWNRVRLDGYATWRIGHRARADAAPAWRRGIGCGRRRSWHEAQPAARRVRSAQRRMSRLSHRILWATGLYSPAS